MPKSLAPIVIRIQSEGVVNGKTTIAALIAQALRTAFPATELRVIQEDDDFHYQDAALRVGAVTSAEIAPKILLIDYNERPEQIRQRSPSKHAVVPILDFSGQPSSIPPDPYSLAS